MDTIFVSGIPKGLDCAAASLLIRKHIGTVAQVERVFIQKEKGIGFVTLYDATSVDTVLSLDNKISVNGSNLKLCRHRRGADRHKMQKNPGTFPVKKPDPPDSYSFFGGYNTYSAYRRDVPQTDVLYKYARPVPPKRLQKRKKARKGSRWSSSVPAPKTNAPVGRICKTKYRRKQSNKIVNYSEIMSQASQYVLDKSQPTAKRHLKLSKTRRHTQEKDAVSFESLILPANTPEIKRSDVRPGLVRVHVYRTPTYLFNINVDNHNAFESICAEISRSDKVPLESLLLTYHGRSITRTWPLVLEENSNIHTAVKGNGGMMKAGHLDKSSESEDNRDETSDQRHIDSNELSNWNLGHSTLKKEEEETMQHPNDETTAVETPDVTATENVTSEMAQDVPGFDGGGKPEFPEKNHRPTARTWRLPHDTQVAQSTTSQEKTAAEKTPDGTTSRQDLMSDIVQGTSTSQSTNHQEIKDHQLRMLRQFRDTKNAAETIEIIAEQVEKYVRRDLTKIIYKDVVNHFHVSKQEFLKHILENLAQEDRFKLIIEYIQDPYTYSLEYLKTFTDNRWFGKNSKYHEYAYKQVNKIYKEVEIIVTESRASSVRLWLESVQCKLENTLSVKMENMSLVQEQISIDMDSFQKTLERQLCGILGKLKEKFRLDNENTVTWHKETPYDRAMKELWGCKEICPFCYEPCKLDCIHDGLPHECIQHRALGVNGRRHKENKSLVIDNCSVMVQSTMEFESGKGRLCTRKPGKCTLDGITAETHHYREYKKYAPDWKIRPCSDISSSTYWVWVLCRYNTLFAEHYSAEEALTPSLLINLVKKDAIDSLHEQPQRSRSFLDILLGPLFRLLGKD